MQIYLLEFGGFVAKLVLLHNNKQRLTSDTKNNKKTLIDSINSNLKKLITNEGGKIINNNPIKTSKFISPLLSKHEIVKKKAFLEIDE